MSARALITVLALIALLVNAMAMTRPAAFAQGQAPTVQMTTTAAASGGPVITDVAFDQIAETTICRGHSSSGETDGGIPAHCDHCPLCTIDHAGQFALPAAHYPAVIGPVGAETGRALADLHADFQRRIRPQGRAPPMMLG